MSASTGLTPWKSCLEPWIGRDVKDLVEKGILVPQSGKVRDVSYGISISADRILVPGPKD